MILFFGLLTTGLLCVAYSLYVEVDASGASATTNYLPYLRCSSP
jgi:inorganic phosphate transporter, PiT family